MTESRPSRASGWRRLPRRVRVRPHPWMPGEMLLGANVELPPGADPSGVLTTVRDNVAKLLGDIPVERPEPEDDPPLVVPGLERTRPLLFVHIRLGSLEPRVMRQAIARLNVEAEHGGLGSGIELVAATPNWFGAAQQDCCGGSPASLPVPAEPYGSRVRYAPQLEALDLLQRATAASHDNPQAVQVAVLDTAPDIEDVEWAHDAFPDNRHLHDLLDRLVPPPGALPPSPLESARASALRRLEVNGEFRPVELVEPTDVRDHGLFVAGVLHATAPWARIRLVRVLNNSGIGSLHSLLIALIGLIEAKRTREPLVVNLSLGMLPALEQLPFIWFGFPIPGLPGCPEDTTLQFLPGEPKLSAAELEELIRRRDPRVQSAIDRLHEPVRRLIRMLQANNCLVVAAAGNDTVFRGVERTPRWNPRIPAVYDDALGVAADTIRHGVPARYSNRGELSSATIRDAVATLGGDLADDGLSPRSGVIGVYTSEQFPGDSGAWNESGWAEWSGTSFAAPIIAGVAANLWQTQSGKTAAQILAEMNAAVRAGGRPNVGDLGVPGVPVRLTWLP